MNKKQSLITFILILVIMHVLVFLIGGLDPTSSNSNDSGSYTGFILGMEVILLPISGILFLFIYGIHSIIKRFIKK